MRKGEEYGVSYYFMTDEEFDKKIAEGEVVEWDEFCGKKYGTLRSELEHRIENGQDVIMDITVEGALAIKNAFPKEAVLIFILPPSYDELARRIRGRKRESEEQLAERINVARGEIARADCFDFIVVNDDLGQALDDLCSIIRSERQRYFRNTGSIDKFKL